MMSNTELPRGLRNNNPGNIRHGPSKWQGLAEIQSDKLFCTFMNATFGIRALAKILLNYQNFYGEKTDTVAEIISRWAPDTENPTEAYINAVAKACAVAPEDKVDVHVMAVMLPMVKAIIRQENAGQQPFDDDLLTSALALAGVKP